MVFSSHVFLFYFLPLVLLIVYIVPFRALSLVIALASYVFYAWFNPKWLILLFISTMVDYVCGLVLAYSSGLPREVDELPMLTPNSPRNRLQRAALFTSIGTNIAILGFFKYFDFGLETINSAAAAISLGSVPVQALHVALPVGISFYTFQSMSYAIDVYRGEARPMRSPVDFACFVALFPHQIAGPIIRYHSIAEQIRRRSFTFEKFSRGVAFVSLGLAKKILLANPMGHVADNAFAASALGWHQAWFGVIAYAFQIYFDFSGYSDMAVGLALMLGFLFIKNFDDPYRALSITDFWRRWHIALSTWLRDYLYVPLGGNRLSASRTYVNLLTVMVIGGLWHGASWTFVIWGTIHGGLLAVERAHNRRTVYAAIPRAGQIAVTFLIVCIGLGVFPG
jgi:alginate O-acetyltransferase complex protein AlgI